MSNVIPFPVAGQQAECRREREHRDHLEQLFKAFEQRRLSKPDRDPPPGAA